MVKFLLQRPIAVLMAFTACFIVGLVTYFSLPVSLLPDIAIPQITIQMTGENSSARELENTVVTPVRRQLLQVAGLREISPYKAQVQYLRQLIKRDAFFKPYR
ncbi:efflux RND transporter permease subunit, partial [Phocaeicola dorei]|uniref:efflux RND transporter permease subunit n=1 Tax=Phocaeicola dorei TaxID=357276 RepID=UPI0039B5A316